MAIIMNAFIANVTKPNVTRAGDEMDSRGGSAVPTKRLEMGSLVCTGKLSQGPARRCLFLPTQSNG